MGGEPEDTPSFFKILLRDSVDYLPLSTAFVKKHLEGKFPRNPVLKTESDKSWAVKIEQIDKKYCFVNGWLKFMRDNKVKVGDILVFWLLGDSTTFEVVLYGPDGCEKVVNSAKKSKFSRANSSMPPTNDASDKSRKSSRKKKFEEERDGLPKEGNPAKKVQPSFRRVMMKSHIYAMPFSASFVRETGTDSKKGTVLRDPEGRVWPVAIVKRCYGTIYSMTTGWKDFRKANKLQTGDTCVFQLLPPEQGNLIDVQVFKKRGRVGRPSKAST